MNYIEEYASKVHANGYRVLPISEGEKYPVGLREWNSLPQDATEFGRWIEEGYTGLGIVCGTDLIAIDIDVYHGDVVDNIIDIVSVIGELDLAMQRTGLPPKTMLLFRVTEPIKKSSTSVYKCHKGHRNQVEILGDGQQFVAFGLHPQIHQEYHWDLGDPTEVALADLPVITPEQIERIMVAVETYLADLWGQHPADLPKIAENRADSMLLEYKSPLNLTPDDIREVLHKLPLSFCDERSEWVKIGMAIYHQTGGDPSGLAYWDEFSQQSEKYQVGCCDPLWESFHRDDHERQITFRHVIAIARDHLPERPVNVPVDGFSQAAKSFDAVPRPRPPMFIAPCFGLGTSTMIFGRSGLGKSYLAWDLVRALHEGDQWLGIDIDMVTQPVTMIVDGELPPELLQDRLHEAFIGELPSDLYILSRQDLLVSQEINFDLSQAGYRKALLDEALAKGVNVMILDNKMSLVIGIEENSASENSPIVSWIYEVRAHGIMLILVHHANKTGGQRGTTVYEDAMDSILNLTQGSTTKGANAERSRMLVWDKNRRGRPDGMEDQIELFMSKKGTLPVTFERSEYVNSDYLNMLLIDVAAYSSASLRERADRLKSIGGKDKIRRLIDELLSNGYIRADSVDGKSTMMYQLTQKGKEYQLGTNDFGIYRDEDY